MFGFCLSQVPPPSLALQYQIWTANLGWPSAGFVFACVRVYFFERMDYFQEPKTRRKQTPAVFLPSPSFPSRRCNREERKKIGHMWANGFCAILCSYASLCSCGWSQLVEYLCHVPASSIGQIDGKRHASTTQLVVDRISYSMKSVAQTCELHAYTSGEAGLFCVWGVGDAGLRSNQSRGTDDYQPFFGPPRQLNLPVFALSTAAYTSGYRVWIRWTLLQAQARRRKFFACGDGYPHVCRTPSSWNTVTGTRYTPNTLASCVVKQGCRAQYSSGLSRRLA